MIVISAIKELDIAIEAMRHGAYHYISKDFDPEGVRIARRQRQRAPGSEPPRDARSAPRSPSRTTASSSSGRAGDARHHRPGPEDRQAVGDGADPRRERHRQGAARAAAFIAKSGDPTRPFVAVNLAAIPKELVESTLFGHEKGSFTGAIRQQLGKFELAGGGTLFLDEIGDLQLDLQAKLLRAIQEGEIERVGGSQPIKTDFRLIAATNVDLDKAVKDGRFREDLFYRLNVIPIRMPPLRERIEDLPELARFFLRALQHEVPQAHRGHRGLDAAHPRPVLVAGQHPRAREPDRAARGRLRQGLDHRRRPAVRAPCRAARLAGPNGENLLEEADVDLRAQLPHPRAREIGWNVTGDGARRSAFRSAR